MKILSRFFQIVQTARSHFSVTKIAWKFKLQPIFLTGQMYKSLIIHVLKLYFLVLNKCPSNDVRLYLIYLFTRLWVYQNFVYLYRKKQTQKEAFIYDH